MSLLEDIFLRDEASEAQELERIIEGDEYEERRRSVSSNSDNASEKEDEAVEEKVRIDPTQAKTKRVVKNPRFILNPARLTGPRGIQVIPEHFKDFKFKGKGHEREDLDLVLKKLEHWAYRLYPKFQFEDCLKKIETLGKKRPVMVHLTKIRSDQFMDEPVVQKDSSDDEAPQPEEDEFDKLLQQQIELARATPAPGSVKKGFETPSVDKRSPLTSLMPKATSSPSISEEQKQRMIRNRQLAEERRLARLKQNNSTIDLTGHLSTVSEVVDNDGENEHIDLTNNAAKTNTDMVRRKLNNKSNVIESSDDEVEKSIDLTNNPAGAKIPRNINIDLTDDAVNSNQIHRRKINKSNVIDSSDDELEESIDLTNNAGNTDIVRQKVNNLNDVDTSDDEVEISNVNQSVTVDVHNTVRNNSIHYSSDDHNDDENVELVKGKVLNVSSKRNTVLDSSEDDDVEKKNNGKVNKELELDTVEDMQITEITIKNAKSNVLDDEGQNDDKEREVNNHGDNEVVEHDEQYVSNKNTKDYSNVQAEKNPVSTIIDKENLDVNALNVSQEIVHGKEVISEETELMDVDFGDDF